TPLPPVARGSRRSLSGILAPLLPRCVDRPLDDLAGLRVDLDELPALWQANLGAPERRDRARSCQRAVHPIRLAVGRGGALRQPQPLPVLLHRPQGALPEVASEILPAARLVAFAYLFEGAGRVAPHDFLRADAHAGGALPPRRRALRGVDHHIGA